MKIACVANGWFPQAAGGLEKYAFGLTHQLTNDGDFVDLFVTGDPQPWSSRSRTYSLADPATSLLTRAVAARRCFAANYAEPYDVLNVHFAMNALPLISRVSRRTPRVCNFQGPWAEEARIEGDGVLAVGVKRWLERRIYRRMDRFITLSTAFKTLLERDYDIDPDRIDVIPIGIDTETFKPAVDRVAARRDAGWPADRFVIFTARRLVQRVGLNTLIDAVAAIPDHARRISVKIAGRGPLEPELRRAIADRGLGSTVELLGFLSEAELVRAYQAADLTIVPTQFLEGFGTIISESLACGTPVAVTPVGGMPEALEPFSPQLITRSPSSSDIAMLLDAAAAGQIALPSRESARAYAVAAWSWPSVARRVRGVFEHAMAARE